MVPFCCFFFVKYSFLLFFFADCERHLKTSPRLARLLPLEKSSAKIKKRVVKRCTHHQENQLYENIESILRILWLLTFFFVWRTRYFAASFFVQWFEVFPQYSKYSLTLETPLVSCTWVTLYAVAISSYIYLCIYSLYTTHTLHTNRLAASIRCWPSRISVVLPRLIWKKKKICGAKTKSFPTYFSHLKSPWQITCWRPQTVILKVLAYEYTADRYGFRRSIILEISLHAWTDPLLTWVLVRQCWWYTHLHLRFVWLSALVKAAPCSLKCSELSPL